MIFEKIYACRGKVLLADVVNFLRALDTDIDDNVKVSGFSTVLKNVVST